MTRPTSLDLTLTLGVLALAACGESPIPTQPATAGNPAPAADQPELLSSGLGSWTTRAPMPTARGNLAAAVVNNASGQPVLYAIGGEDGLPTVLGRVEAYNFATNVWSRKASLPHPRTANSAAVIAGKIYVSGGLSSSDAAVNSLYVYDPGSNTWITRASMPVTSWYGLSAAINGKLYVLVGGCATCSTRYPHRLYRYDPSSNTWTRRADCPRQHIFGTAGVIDGKFYVVGGDDGTFDIQSAQGWLDVYNPVTNTWTAKAPGAGRVAGAATVLAKKLYVVGGNTGEDDIAAMLAYDPATNTWAGKAPMKTARSGLAARTVTYGGVSYILAVGGFLPNGQGVTGILERYTP